MHTQHLSVICVHVCMYVSKYWSLRLEKVYQQIHWAQPEQAESGDVQSLFFFSKTPFPCLFSKNFLLLFPQILLLGINFR